MVDTILTIATMLITLSVMGMIIAFQVHLYRDAYVKKGWLYGSMGDKAFFWCMLPMSIAFTLVIVAFIIDGFKVGAL